MKEPTRSRKAYYLLIPLGFVLVFLFLFHEEILTEAGRFLAPEGKGDADVVIVEGVELVKQRAVEMGLRILSSGRANRLVVVDYGSETERGATCSRPTKLSSLLPHKKMLPEGSLNIR